VIARGSMILCENTWTLVAGGSAFEVEIMLRERGPVVAVNPGIPPAIVAAAVHSAHLKCGRASWREPRRFRVRWKYDHKIFDKDELSALRRRCVKRRRSFNQAEMCREHSRSPPASRVGLVTICRALRADVNRRPVKDQQAAISSNSISSNRVRNSNRINHSSQECRAGEGPKASRSSRRKAPKAARRSISGRRKPPKAARRSRSSRRRPPKAAAADSRSRSRR